MLYNEWNGICRIHKRPIQKYLASRVSAMEAEREGDREKQRGKKASFIRIGIKSKLKRNEEKNSAHKRVFREAYTHTNKDWLIGGIRRLVCFFLFFFSASSWCQWKIFRSYSVIICTASAAPQLYKIWVYSSSNNNGGGGSSNSSRIGVSICRNIKLITITNHWHCKSVFFVSIPAITLNTICRIRV